MLEGVVSAVVFLATCAWIVAILFGRWMPKDAVAKVSGSFLDKGRLDKWSHAASALLVAVLDQILWNKISDSRKKTFRSLASAFAILLLALSLAGLVSKTLLGFKQSPWEAYDATVESFLKVSNLHEAKSPEEKKAMEEMLETLLVASAPHWKYVYAVCAISMTLFLRRPPALSSGWH